jgi:ABC-2 type transport system permease protein
VTLAVDRWPTFTDERPRVRERQPGTAVVWRLEMAKLVRQLRVQAATAVCLLAPFVVLAAVKVQSAVPQDTLFGQWLHESGYALPMVIVGFTGQWVLPLLTSLVAGDIFSAEDHFGTWKTVLTRSRTRGQVFAGKALAAVTYTILELLLLAASSVAAGVILGTQPVVGLSGQLVPSGSAFDLVVASWAVQLPPLLGFCALSLFLSIVSRNSPVGIGAPLVFGLVMQLASLVNIPDGLRVVLLSTPFGAWHGLWTDPAFFGPVRQGLVTSAAWAGLGGLAAWLVFRRRAFGAW